MSVGSDLRQIRESKGISLEHVAQKTKIALKYLEAIESDQYDVFPSHTYAKGFLRAFAKVVGADPLLITRQFEEEVSPKPVQIHPTVEVDDARGPSLFERRRMPDLPPQPTPQDFLITFDEEAEAAREQERVPLKTEPFLRRDRALLPPGAWRKRALKAGAVLAALVLVVIVWNFFKAHPVRFAKKPKPAVSVPAVTPEPAEEAVPAPKKKPTAVPTAVPTPEPVTEQKKEEPRKAEKPEERKAQAKEAPLTFHDKYHHIVLKGREDSWMLVGMDGDKTWEFVLNKGEVKSFKAKDYFTLKVGNAAGVDLWYDGDPQGVLGMPAQVVELRYPKK